jgi:hypothetical protein
MFFTNYLRQIGDYSQRLIPSSLGNAFDSFQSSWVLVAGALLLLPLISMFTRPLIRLAAVFLSSVSAIVGALIVSLSTWCVVAIRCIGAIPRILTPRVIPGLASLKHSPTLPYVFGALVLLAVLLSKFVWTKRDLHACLVDGSIEQSCVASLKAKSF